MIADICTFPDSGIVEDLYLDRLRAGKPIASPDVHRFRIDHMGGAVAAEKLFDQGFDLPRINYRRCNERPYRYVWGVGTDGAGLLRPDRRRRPRGPRDERLARARPLPR